MVARGGSLPEVEEISEGGQKVKTSSQKINTFWGCNEQHSDCRSKFCIAYVKVTKSRSLKFLS